MMSRKPLSAAWVTVVVLCPAVQAYVEAPHTLGRCCQESTNVVLVEVVLVNKDKGVIIYKKVQDLKGKHPGEEIKHNIGKRGFHPREWQNVMAWAEVGKRAVFFHNGGASETCIGTYWYQCYKEGDWWGMSHAEPFLLRTYSGDVEKLAAAVTNIMAGKQVVVTCLADGNKEQLHQRKGKLQRMKASLKLQDYNPKRDFVGWGGDGDGGAEEFKTFVLLAESTPGWKYLPRSQVRDENWQKAVYDDAKWRSGKAPIGYGEEEIAKRKGTVVPEMGQPFLFRRIVEVPSDLLAQKSVRFQLRVASDDSAVVFLNGTLIDHDPVEDHEFSYWNRDVEVAAKQFKAGRNVIAVLVKNRPRSSDIYLDMELAAQVPLPKIVRRKPTPAPASPNKATTTQPAKLVPDAPGKPQMVLVDKQKRTVTIPCAIAPRKLPNLNEVYPIEVIGTYPTPQGQKAHETVVTCTGIKPSAVHKALVDLGLRPGKPARGEGTKAEGPELSLFLEITEAVGKVRRMPIEEALVDRKTGKPLGALKWHFTGSTLRQPDPERDDKVYGADITGTLIALFPVTDDTVIQSQLTMKDEPVLKLETDRKRLPKEGTAARLILQVK
ncbi:MAG TPA: YdjY domain-containing protein [Gemmataceae bacterium]